MDKLKRANKNKSLKNEELKKQRTTIRACK